MIIEVVPARWFPEAVGTQDSRAVSLKIILRPLARAKRQFIIWTNRCYDVFATTETKAELIHRRGPMAILRGRGVRNAGPASIGSTIARLLEPIGAIPSAEAEERYFAMLEPQIQPDSNQPASREPGVRSIVDICIVIPADHTMGQAG